MVGVVYKFGGLDFTYVGKNRFAGAKAHWQPFPYPIRPPLGKGKQKGQSDRKGFATQDAAEEEQKKPDKDQGPGAKDWFT
eukprot:56703-Heterocapsa_arctica.AAC.1